MWVCVCCSVLFCSVLFCSVLFCSVLFCSVLFCSVLFCSVLFCSVLFCSVLFCSVLFCSVQSCTAAESRPVTSHHFTEARNRTPSSLYVTHALNHTTSHLEVRQIGTQRHHHHDTLSPWPPVKESLCGVALAVGTSAPWSWCGLQAHARILCAALTAVRTEPQLHCTALDPLSSTCTGRGRADPRLPGSLQSRVGAARAVDGEPGSRVWCSPSGFI